MKTMEFVLGRGRQGKLCVNLIDTLFIVEWRDDFQVFLIAPLIVFLIHIKTNI